LRVNHSDPVALPAIEV